MNKIKKPRQRKGEVKEFIPTFNGKQVRFFDQITSGTSRQLFASVSEKIYKKRSKLVLIELDTKNSEPEREQIRRVILTGDNVMVLKVGWNLILCKKGGNLFVASIRRFVSGRFLEGVSLFNRTYVWSVKRQFRLVVSAPFDK